jgi:hypothetical protein
VIRGAGRGKGIWMKSAIVSLAAFGLALLLSTGAFAFTVSHLATDAELLALVSDTIFVAEGRIGDLGGAATFELDLGQSTAAPYTTAQYPWVSGAVEPFTLTYNAGTGIVTFSLGGRVLTYTTPYPMFGDIFVRTRAVDADRSVIVQDLVLNGSNVGDVSNSIGPGLDILWISGAELAGGFTLTGTATLAWMGAAPTQSRLAFQIKVAKLAVVGTEDESWGGIKALYR